MEGYGLLVVGYSGCFLGFGKTNILTGNAYQNGDFDINMVV